MACSVAFLEAGGKLPSANSTDEMWLTCANDFCKSKGYPEPVVDDPSDPFHSCITCGPHLLCPSSTVAQNPGWQQTQPTQPAQPVATAGGGGSVLLAVGLAGLVWWLLKKLENADGLAHVGSHRWRRLPGVQAAGWKSSCDDTGNNANDLWQYWCP